MKRRVCYLPVETIVFNAVNEKGEIIKEVEFTFNNYAITTLKSEFGDINEVFKKHEKKPYDMAAILLYVGVKPNQLDFTLEEAREIVASGGSGVLSEVMSSVTNTFISIGGDEVRENFMKQMEGMGMKDVALMMMNSH